MSPVSFCVIVFVYSTGSPDGPASTYRIIPSIPAITTSSFSLISILLPFTFTEPNWFSVPSNATFAPEPSEYSAVMSTSPSTTAEPGCETLPPALTVSDSASRAPRSNAVDVVTETSSPLPCKAPTSLAAEASEMSLPSALTVSVMALIVSPASSPPCVAASLRMTSSAWMSALSGSEFTAFCSSTPLIVI